MFGGFFELVGLIVVAEKGRWTLGMLLGTLAAVGLSVSMYKGLAGCLSMDPAAARRSMTIQSIIRLIVMLVVAWLGLRLPFLSFPAVITGMLGLKASAHMHMYTNLYITKKLLRKGG